MNIPALREFFNTQAPITQRLGTIDCVSFVTQAIFIGWGRDYRDILQYNDRRSAVARLRELGGLKAACFHTLGPMYFICDLNPGDVIWFDKPPSIGLLMPTYIAVKQGVTINRYVLEAHLMGWRT